MSSLIFFFSSLLVTVCSLLRPATLSTPPAAHEAHAAAAEEDEEGMYASEEPGEEVEQGRAGNPAPVVPVQGHAEHEAGGEGQREDAVTGVSGDV